MARVKILVVVGSGPGIGVATAAQFVSKDFTVALISRNARRLEKDAETVRQSASGSNVQVKTFVADTGDHVALKKVLESVKQSLGSPEVVFFNAARVSESQIGVTEPEFILDDFKSMNIGLYVAATWALPLLSEIAKLPESWPSFLISGGSIHDHPSAVHFSLSMQKAAQYNFAGSLSQVAGPQGIHVATIVIGGVVSPDDPVINAENVADHAWNLHLQRKDTWQNVVHVGGINDLIKPTQEK